MVLSTRGAPILGIDWMIAVFQGMGSLPYAQELIGN
jgi:hypothetical protein